MDTKKSFQMTIKTIRENRNARLNVNSKFPKAMMTNVQMAKGTATVNCGGEWASNEVSKDRANEVVQDAGFIKFCEDFNATATIEYQPQFDTYQVRLHF